MRFRPCSAIVLVVLTALLPACGGDDLAGPQTGSLEITTATVGADLGPTNFAILLDGTDVGAVASAGTVTLADLSPGDHTVGLGGLGSNCQVSGENSRKVTVTAGEKSAVSYAVTCVAETGALRVSTATSGPDPDPDGYVLSLDGTDAQPMGVDTSVTLAAVSIGQHVVGLSGLASNCGVQEENPRSVTVATADTAETAFTVVCTPITGTVVVQVASSGSPQDQDGYVATLDNSDSVHIAPNTTTATFAQVVPGPRTVSLTDVVSNCSLEGDPQRAITVGAGEAVTVTFSIHCTAPIGLRWDAIPVLADAVRGTGPANVYAVEGTHVQRYDGSNWSEIAPGMPDVEGLQAVWPDAAPNVYVAGTGGGAGLIIRFDGSQWAEVARFVDPEAQFGDYGVVHSLWGVAPDEIFAVGSFEHAEEKSGRALIARYDGTTWTRMEIPGESYFGYRLLDVWASSGHDVYAVGTAGLEPGRGVVFHYDGSTWKVVLTTPEHYIESVWGTGPADVYVLPRGGPVRHWDGSTWSEQDKPPTPPMSSMSGSSSTDIYAVGFEGTIMRYDGARWTLQPSGTNLWLRDVWGSSPTDVYVAVGAFLLHGTP